MYTNYAVTAACVAAKHDDMTRARRHAPPRQPKTRRTRPTSRVNPLSAIAALRFFPAKAAPKGP